MHECTHTIKKSRLNTSDCVDGCKRKKWVCKTKPKDRAMARTAVAIGYIE